MYTVRTAVHSVIRLNSKPPQVSDLACPRLMESTTIGSKQSKAVTTFEGKGLRVAAVDFPLCRWINIMQSDTSVVID